MKHNYASALTKIKPGKEWTIYGGTYEGLVWHDDPSSKPTKQELEQAIIELDQLEPMRLLREERNKRLVASDWMASQDRVMTQAEKDYRQALRDLPDNSTPLLNNNYELDLNSINWPVL